jgi:hypothetical protein
MPCLCALQGFSAVWDGTVLTCVEQQKHAQHRSIIIAVAVASAAVLAVALIVWRQYLRTRPRWLRERVLQVRATLCASQHSLHGSLQSHTAAVFMMHRVITRPVKELL